MCQKYFQISGNYSILTCFPLSNTESSLIICESRGSGILTCLRIFWRALVKTAGHWAHSLWFWLRRFAVDFRNLLCAENVKKFKYSVLGHTLRHNLWKLVVWSCLLLEWHGSLLCICFYILLFNWGNSQGGLGCTTEESHLQTFSGSQGQSSCPRAYTAIPGQGPMALLLLVPSLYHNGGSTFWKLAGRHV